MFLPGIKYRKNATMAKAIILNLLLSLAFSHSFIPNASAQKIHKFERISMADGLSQNYVQSILCDDKGFLWFGTWDGLNRYDGRQFKVFKVDPSKQNTLTNNRIIDLWQDRQNKIWIKTNDGYFHYFIDETYEFITFPYYLKSLEERNSTIACFAESDLGEVLLGSTNSGFYILQYDTNEGRYLSRQFQSRGESSISHNTVTFIITDDEAGIWIGTKKGLNHVVREEIIKEEPGFSNYWLQHEFTTGLRVDNLLLFGTKATGIKTFEPALRRFDQNPALFRNLANSTITVFASPFKNIVLAGTEGEGLFIFNTSEKKLINHILDGKTIHKIFKDHFDNLWINTNEFGICKLEKDLKTLTRYELTEDNIRSIVDDERQFLFEDSQHNLWIALHGSGLAYYNRQTGAFEFYRNVPGDNTTISSDNVYCITEDHSGLLWVGTGPANGGVNKVQASNETFQQVILEQNIVSGNENLVRSLLVDSNGIIWSGTKSGDMYLLDEDYNIIRKMDQMPVVNGTIPGQNVYTMLQDRDGYIWVGTKGGGIFVTQYSVSDPKFNYGNVKFWNYTHSIKEPTSLSSNIIYCILQDSRERIWVGSYDGGLNLVKERNNQLLICQRYNTTNSEISSDKVRHLLEDHSGRLWITTAFGLTWLDLNAFTGETPEFHPILFDPRKPNSLSYNDVIHAFEDSENNLWLATSGGGVNKLLYLEGDSVSFEHISTKNGLVNDVVYSVIQDTLGMLWFSTDHGITRYNATEGLFDNFDEGNNLTADAFNENTSAITKSGRLLFGTNEGILVVHPEKIEQNDFMPRVVLTNFQLFNKDIDINDPASPVKKDIESLDHIVLNYNQASFSFEYAALSFFAPFRNRYAFMLENFDRQWNEVGNQNKATYTNLAPGNYVFKVKAANWNSPWNENSRNVQITILPPWWKTTPMYFVYAITLIIILEIIRRTYTRYQKLQNDLKVEKRVNDIKLQFFTNISHEIRTPLTLILGPIHDIMEMRNIPKSIALKLHLIEKNGKRMLRLVNQLLDFRKVQKNKMTLHVHKIPVYSFLDSIIENFDLIARHKKITLEFEHKSRETEIWADPNKFDSVIFNILSNALKFSPKGGQVTISVDDSNESVLDITIADQGVGIPKNRLNFLFERFTPLAEDNDEFGSSGIGLAYSYQIMKLHHGDILVKSEPGKGSEFTIRMPLGNEHFSEAEIKHEEGESFYKLRFDKDLADDELDELIEKTPDEEKDIAILIVEDNHQIVNYLKENLSDEYRISTAYNGQEALDCISTHPAPDLIITDIMMPVMDGITLTHRLKDSMDTSHIPVIMLTAKSTLEDQVEGIDSGAEAYILKPFNMTYVRAVIGNLLKQRQILSSRYIENTYDELTELKITTKDEKFLEDISRLIMDNYSDPEFNIEKLVEQSYVSRTVFYHKIKTLTGLTPIDFLRQKRLHIASRLILETDYNVSEIALITGFNDVKNFSKRFKEIYKRTPTQFKQEMMAN